VAYCIMRMEKVKHKAGLVGRLRHNTREHISQNVDPDRTKKNLLVGGSVDEVMGHYERLLPEKVRKNAVYAVEVMMTASPEFSGDWNKYLTACDEWVAGIFGRENVLSVAHHLDESTPHTQIMVIPLKDGKLNAKHFIGGSRDRMTELQDDFYQKVGHPAGLERGQSRKETRARHTPHTLAATAAKLDEREKKVEEALKVPVDEALVAIDYYKKLRTRTPRDLITLAGKIQEKKCLTWGEYRDKMQREYELEQKKKQQQQRSKGRGRSL